MTTIEFYPSEDEFLFDLDVYETACSHWRAKADKAFAHKKAKEFPGALGRQRQRAYFDAARDLLVPVIADSPGVIRVPVPSRDIEGASARLLETAAELRLEIHRELPELAVTGEVNQLDYHGLLSQLIDLQGSYLVVSFSTHGNTAFSFFDAIMTRGYSANHPELLGHSEESVELEFSNGTTLTIDPELFTGGSVTEGRIVKFDLAGVEITIIEAPKD